MKYDIYHHGIQGMKWGIRRYQNKDGTLTNAGKKRYDSELAKVKYEQKVLANRKRTAAKLSKLDAEKQKLADMKDVKKVSVDNTPTKKSFKDMSDDELRQEVNRLSLERQAYDLQRQLATLNPKQLSAGEKFTKNILGSVVAPALKDAGRSVATDYLKKVGKEKLGLSDKSELDKLRDESAKLSYKKRITEVNDFYNARKANSASASKDSKSETGPVTGEGNSSFKPKDGPVYDADYTYVKNSSYTKAGEQYISNMLEDKKK